MKTFYNVAHLISSQWTRNYKYSILLKLTLICVLIDENRNESTWMWSTVIKESRKEMQGKMTRHIKCEKDLHTQKIHGDPYLQP